ncbi:MAG: serine/threonine-protein kinase [Archangium sp.]
MKKPSIFGKYLLLERLNVGGMAEVFVAKAFGVEGFERILAIKKILPTMAEDEEFITMFIDEARISVQLNHANVVHIHELGKHDDAYYIAMEYVSGKDLRALLERFRRRKEIMPTAMAVFCATKICEGLDYAHRKKDARGQELHIIHRDVSPQNILISYEGEVKIIDFGIAKAANRSQKTQAGILKGKFGYMSPEQVRGLPINRRSDVFAVGVILYEMLTGEKLFVGESDFSTLEKVRNAEVPTPRQFNPNIPAGLEKVVMKSLAREAEDRYQWSSDLQEDLMRFLLAGDAIYSAKHLSAFMKDAFAEDLLRENEKMERFAGVEKPEQVEASGITAAPKPPPAAPRRNTAQPSALAALSSGGSSNPPPRRPSQGVAVSAGSGAVAMGIQSAKIEIPPPSEEELAEMDGAKDRTVIVDNSDPTALGTSPFSSPGGPPKLEPTAPAGNKLRPNAPTSGNSTTQDNLAPAATSRPSGGLKGLRNLPVDETLVPQPRSSLIDDDSGANDLRPIEMTGFRPALESAESTGEQPALNVQSAVDSTVPPRSSGRPKIVIGDAPVGGATSIGPSPFAKSETRMYDTGEGDEEVQPDPTGNHQQVEEEEQQQDEEQQYDEEQQQEEELGEEGQENSTDERPALPAKTKVDPKAKGAQAAQATVRKPPQKGAPAADNKRKGLLIAIAATAVLVLIVAIAGIVKFVGGGPKSSVIINPSPKDVPFTLVINPGAIRMEKPTKAIELDPGEYSFEFKPTVPGYLSTKKPVSVKAGKTAPQPVSVTFTKAQQDPVAVNPDTPDTPKTPDTNTKPPDPVNPPKPEVTLWSVTINSSDPASGVEIILDGKSRGVTPVTIKDLAVGKTYEFTAKKTGYETQTFSLTNTDKVEKLDKDLVLKKVEKPEPVVKNNPPPKKDPEPVVKNDPPPKKDPEPVVKNDPPPKKDPVVKNDPPPKKDPEPKNDPPPKKDPPKAKGSGRVAFASKPLGADIVVDGKNTGKKTPLPQAAALELPLGKHKVIFKLDGKSSAPYEFEVTEEHKEKALVVKGEI